MKYLALLIATFFVANATWAQPPAAFKQCAHCHRVEAGRHGVGPSLFGVYGRPAASAPDYRYSEALALSGVTWNERALDHYLRDPKAYIRGSRKAAAGVKSDEDVYAIIDYLRTLQ
jgi:cytochrome c